MSQIKSEMAATVWKIKVGVGDEVTAGDEVALVESMKMEIPVTASATGVVSAIHVAEGGLVGPGDLMFEISPG